MAVPVITESTLVASNWMVVFALALPHLLYAYIWFFPQKWRAGFREKSVDIFASLAGALKVYQFSSVLYWYVLRRPEGIDFAAISPLELALGLALGFVGQLLNIAIYRAIGKAGVYYGFKLGHRIPWVTGFPFNTVSHPQYVGSTLTVWAVAALLWSQAPAGFNLIACYWTALYVITGYKEDKLN